MGDEMKQPSIVPVYFLHEVPVSPEQALADANRRWWRRVDVRRICMQVARDNQGRFTRLIIECPDCHELVASPRLRTEADMEALLDSDLTDHHRCVAMEEN
jgi:hypothetical protein